MSEWIPVKEAAEITGYRPCAILKQINKGRIPARWSVRKQNSCFLVTVKGVLAWRNRPTYHVRNQSVKVREWLKIYPDARGTEEMYNRFKQDTGCKTIGFRYWRKIIYTERQKGKRT